MKILFAGQQEDHQSNNGELKWTYSTHIFIYPFTILHHSTIPFIFFTHLPQFARVLCFL